MGKTNFCQQVESLIEICLKTRKKTSKFVFSNRDKKKKKEGLPEYKSTKLPTEAVAAAAAAYHPNSFSSSWFLGRNKFSHSMETDGTAAYVKIPVTDAYAERIHLLIL